MSQSINMDTPNLDRLCLQMLNVVNDKPLTVQLLVLCEIVALVLNHAGVSAGSKDHRIFEKLFIANLSTRLKSLDADNEQAQDKPSRGTRH